MDKFEMQELNDQVMAGVTAVGIVGLTFALMYFGLAMGY